MSDLQTILDAVTAATDKADTASRDATADAEVVLYELIIQLQGIVADATPNTPEPQAGPTKHTHKPNFGRRVAGCPRCAELAAGDAPRELGWTPRRPEGGYPTNAERVAHRQTCDVCRTGRGVCTFGEW